MVDMGILYMFLNTYKLEPEKANMYMAYIGLPWTPKIVYGIVMDCFPICGSGKRSYVIIMGLLQGLSMLAVVVYKFPNDATWVMILACINAMGCAF